MVFHQKTQKKKVLKVRNLKRYMIFLDVYDFHSDKRKKNKLREPLNIGENVLVFAERLKKKYALGSLFKSTTQNKP